MKRPRKQKKAGSKWVLRVPVSCDGCDGCGRAWVLLRGANIKTTTPCSKCLGLGVVVKFVELPASESRRLDRIAQAHGTS